MPKGKKYSKYKNPNANKNNTIPVEEGSVITSMLSNFEKLPKGVIDHRREAIVVLKFRNDELGVVYLHGIMDINGVIRIGKEEAGLWKRIKKANQEVYVDLDIRIKDAYGNPIKQGKTFQNTGVKITPEELEKVRNHVYKTNGRKKHSIRKTIQLNKNKRAKNSP